MIINAAPTIFDTIQERVQAWENVRVAPYRFGGVELTLGTREFGLLHEHGLLEIPLNDALKKQLIAENKAQCNPHYEHQFWIQYTIHSRGDMTHGLWLLSISHLYHNIQRQKRRGQLTASVQSQFLQTLNQLQMSEPLRNIFKALLS